jgi:acyl-CoA synthetase (AMP-forming)/AMP-acid ligase II
MTTRAFAESPWLAGVTWLATDRLSSPGAEPCDRAVSGGDLAILQYTSGSTGEPKGVMLNHDHLLANARFIRAWLRKAAGTPGVTWLPPYHDMGLMGSVLHPVYERFPAIMMSPLSFLQDPLRWVSAISRYRATLTGAPNFAYELAARSASSGDTSKLDLTCLDAAFCGAEPIRADTIARFVAAFGPRGFREDAFLPTYGLAEATLMVSARVRNRPLRTWSYVTDDLERNVARIAAQGDAARTHVSCGVASAGQTLRIVDPETMRACHAGTVGEIWVQGPNVAAGYWRRRAETDATFRAFLSDSGDGPFLRTGDLGLLQDGELVVTGRLKDLIVLDGKNHYPQDIERTVEACHPALRPGTCVALSVDVGGAERLVVAVERLRHAKLDPDDVKGAVRRAVAQEHGIQVRDVRLLRQGTVLKTSSGKLQRRACKQAYLNNRLIE